MLRNLTTQEYESEKYRIVELMYNPYHQENGDEYIGGQQVSKDKLKNRVDFQLYRNFVPNGSDIQSDIYQEVMVSLLTQNEENTKKFVDKYYQNPNSAYWYAFFLLKRKFSVDKNYPTKPNSIGKKLMYSSSFNPFDSQVTWNVEGDELSEEVELRIDDGWNPTKSTKYDGLVEALNQQLTPEELELFYTLAWNTTSIKKTKDKQILITKLKIKIKEIKDKLEHRMTEQEQYNELMKIEEKLNFFNKYGEVTLEVSDFDILKTLYKVYFNNFKALNTTCSACVREMLNVCISRLSALKKQFTKIEEPKDVAIKLAEAGDTTSTEYAEVVKQIADNNDKAAEMKVESEVKQATSTKKKGKGK